MNKFKYTDKQKNPPFEYIILTGVSGTDYYLFNDFDDAYKCYRNEVKSNDRAVLCVKSFDTGDRTFRAKEAFYMRDDRITFDEHGEVKLHLAFYINAGEWLNPDVDLTKETDDYEPEYR